MPKLTIEDAPEETLRALQAIADRTQRSLSEVALDFLPKGGAPPHRRQPAPVKPLSGGEFDDSTPLIRRLRDGVSDNELTPEEALRRVRDVRSTAPKRVLPDSTAGIRADREAR
ncbi:MAG TPA: hypothetical protein VGU24_18065 [Microvirga sp.]|jgi:hypothetical protein|nr:hypothetical protein [Microvirga sp.]